MGDRTVHLDGGNLWFTGEPSIAGDLKLEIRGHTKKGTHYVIHATFDEHVLSAMVWSLRNQFKELRKNRVARDAENLRVFKEE